jgi:exodeoxyribonuclease VII small subunit
VTDDPEGYTQALTELEAILEEIDADDIDVDVLGAKVKRAAELLRFCRARIDAARFEVEAVVADLGARPTPTIASDDADANNETPTPTTTTTTTAAGSSAPSTTRPSSGTEHTRRSGMRGHAHVTLTHGE